MIAIEYTTRNNPWQSLTHSVLCAPLLSPPSPSPHSNDRTRCPRQLGDGGDLTASVIITYFEEDVMALIRTVVGVIARTPFHLLAEIIVVDDASTNSKADPTHPNK